MYNHHLYLHTHTSNSSSNPPTPSIHPSTHTIHPRASPSPYLKPTPPADLSPTHPCAPQRIAHVPPCKSPGPRHELPFPSTAWRRDTLGTSTLDMGRRVLAGRGGSWRALAGGPRKCVLSWGGPPGWLDSCLRFYMRICVCDFMCMCMCAIRSDTGLKRYCRGSEQVCVYTY